MPCSSAIENASFSRAIASSGLPSRNSSPPRLFSSRPTFIRSVSSSYWDFARSAYVRASTQWPSRSAISEAWKYDLAERARVVHRLGQLERARDVLARGLEVALAAVAARAPGEDVRAEQVGRKRRALDERERLAEERDRGRDARDQVAGDAEPEQHLGRGRDR